MIISIYTNLQFRYRIKETMKELRDIYLKWTDLLGITGADSQ